MLYALMLVGLTARTVAETGTAASAAPCVDKTDKCSLEQWVSLCTDGAGSETSTDNSIHKLASYVQAMCARTCRICEATTAEPDVTPGLVAVDPRAHVDCATAVWQSGQTAFSLCKIEPYSSSCIWSHPVGAERGRCASRPSTATDADTVTSVPGDVVTSTIRTYPTMPQAEHENSNADNETVLTKSIPGSSTASQPVDLDRFVAVAVLSVGVVVLVVSVVQRLCTRSGLSATDELYKTFFMESNDVFSGELSVRTSRLTNFIELDVGDQKTPPKKSTRVHTSPGRRGDGQLKLQHAHVTL